MAAAEDWAARVHRAKNWSAAELAAEYAAMPTRGVGLTKRLFSEAERNTLEEQLELEAELQTAATQTDDFREGVAAFLEKRKPESTGS